MYDSNLRLNKQINAQHRQEIAQQIQRERFARQVEAAQGKHKPTSSVRAVLIAIINLVTS